MIHHAFYEFICSNCDAIVDTWAFEFDTDPLEEPAGLCEPCSVDPSV
jgi:hypothetical protein